MFLRLPSGREGIRHIRPHFYHESSAARTCYAYGESDIHLSAKHKIREHMMVTGRTITIEEEICPTCSSVTRTSSFHSSECKVVLEKRSKNGKWRYDCVIIRGTAAR
jgi:hypothetical protein